MYLAGTRLNHSAKVTWYNKYIKLTIVCSAHNWVDCHRIWPPFCIADLGSLCTIPLKTMSLFFMPLFLSLSLYAYLVLFLTRRSSPHRVLLLLPHWRPCPQHLVSEHWRFFNPLSAVITTQHSVFHFLWRVEKKEDKQEAYLSLC